MANYFITEKCFISLDIRSGDTQDTYILTFNIYILFYLTS